MTKPWEHIITLDSESTRDIDDAFVVYPKSSSSSWCVGVYIADVARHIHKGSSLDKKAYEMTATRYYGTGNSPMIPRRFSEDKLSLWPEKSKSVLGIRFLLDAESLALKDFDVEETTIESLAKLAYKDIPTILESPLDPHHFMLKSASKLAFLLLEKRRKAGAMVLYDINNGWLSTEEGYIRQLKDHRETVGQIIIQELMIATNAAMSTFAIENDIPVLFRNHSARNAAPPREELLAQIQDATNTPIQGLDLLRQRVHMLLEKAEYGPSLKGHYGLNLPAYGHFTSPIRRYADLVNHRQILAHLKGEPFPYLKEDLEKVAQHINETTLAEKEATSSYLKSKAEDRAERSAHDTRRIEGLASKEFERVVKVQVRSGNAPTEALVQAFQLRLREKRVPPICLHAVMIEAPINDDWKPLRQSILQYLGKNPQDGPTILTQATQVSEWSEVTYDSKSVGPSHAPLFTVKGSLNHSDLGHLSVEASASSLKEGKQRASVSLLALYCGLPSPMFPLPVRDDRAAPKSQSKAFKYDPSKDPVAALQEYCQARSLNLPKYTFKLEGPPHMPVVSCEVMVNGVLRSGKANSKKDAKKIAAVQCLKALEIKPQFKQADFRGSHGH